MVMLQFLRPTRLTMARIARQHAIRQRRTFLTPTAYLRADLVQDLYLKELKAYKPSPVKPSDAEGQVQKFSVPQPPRSPEEGNIAQELKAYDEQQVEIEGQATEGEAGVVEEDWFEEEEAEEEPAH